MVGMVDVSLPLWVEKKNFNNPGGFSFVWIAVGFCKQMMCAQNRNFIRKKSLAKQKKGRGRLHELVFGGHLALTIQIFCITVLLYYRSTLQVCSRDMKKEM